MALVWSDLKRRESQWQRKLHQDEVNPWLLRALRFSPTQEGIAMKMNTWAGILLSTSLALVASGCGGGNDDHGQTQQQTQERDQIVAQMQNQMTQVDNHLDQISNRLQGSAGEAREELQEAHAKLARERQTLNTQLTEMRQSNESDWNQAHEDAQKALDDLASRVEGLWTELTQG
jgi:uncharacterized protein HemX